MLSKSFRLLLYVICGLILAIFFVVTALSVTVVVTDDGLSLYSHLFSRNSPRPLLRIVAGVIAVFSALKSLCSILAIEGIKKNIPGLLLPFLGFGAFVAIVVMIVSLLLFISGHFMIGVALLICNGVYMGGLLKVHKGYEIIWNKNGDLQNLLENTLIEE